MLTTRCIDFVPRVQGAVVAWVAWVEPGALDTLAGDAPLGAKTVAETGVRHGSRTPEPGKAVDEMRQGACVDAARACLSAVDRMPM